jgi:hypothetical protein
MHFHPGWSGPAEGFGHEDYYARDGCYGYIDQLWDRRALGQENWTIWNAKLDHLVSPKIATAPDRQHEQGASMNRSSADQPGSNQGRIGPRSETSANDKAKPDAEKSLEEVATKWDMVPKAKAETKIEAGTSS